MQKQKDQFDDQFERQQREHEKQLQAARMDYENLLNSVTSVAKNWHSGQQAADDAMQTMAQLLPADLDEVAPWLSSDTGELILQLFEWLDKDDSGTVEETELTTGIYLEPQQTESLQAMLGSLPPYDISSVDLFGFDCFMHGALRMLFHKLDDNNDHVIDAHELAWVESTFQTPLPSTRPLNVDEFEIMMLQMCVSTASYDGTFQHALLAILTLLEGSRLWQGDSMSQDLGTATVNFWLQDRLKIVFETLCETDQTESATVRLELSHDSPIRGLLGDASTHSMLTYSMFSAFVNDAIRMIHSSNKFESAVHALAIGFGDIDTTNQMITIGKTHGDNPFECMLAKEWASLSKDKAHSMLVALVSSLEMCKDSLKQHSDNLLAARSNEEAIMDSASFMSGTDGVLSSKSSW